MAKCSALLFLSLVTLPLEASQLRRALRASIQVAAQVPGRTLASKPVQVSKELEGVPRAKIALAGAVNQHRHPFSLLIKQGNHSFAVTCRINDRVGPPIDIDHKVNSADLVGQWIAGGNQHAAIELATAQTLDQITEAEYRKQFWDRVARAENIEVHEGCFLIGDSPKNAQAIAELGGTFPTYSEQKAWLGQIEEQGLGSLQLIRLLAAYSADQLPSAYLFQLMGFENMSAAWASMEKDSQTWSGVFEQKVEKNPIPFPESQH